MHGKLRNFYVRLSYKSVYVIISNLQITIFAWQVYLLLIYKNIKYCITSLCWLFFILCQAVLGRCDLQDGRYIKLPFLVVLSLLYHVISQDKLNILRQLSYSLIMPIGFRSRNVRSSQTARNTEFSSHYWVNTKGVPETASEHCYNR